MPTKIEWCTETWNPATGCTKVSGGCQNCYAERMSKRLAGRYGYPANEPFRVTLHPDRLEQPLRWRKPRTIFVPSMGDLFHKDVPFEFISKVFTTMKACQARGLGHTFLLLTKRPGRMLEYWRWWRALCASDEVALKYHDHIWLGVTAENQAMADERIPLLLSTPAAVRFVSCEPLLGAIDLFRAVYGEPSTYLLSTGAYGWPDYCNIKTTNMTYPNSAGIDWIIAGGESGPGARPMRPGWARGLRDQCQAAGTKFFFKAWGAHSWPGDDRRGNAGPPVRVGKKAAGRLLDGREWNEYPGATL